jgi:hypothetical protein
MRSFLGVWCCRYHVRKEGTKDGGREGRRKERRKGRRRKDVCTHLGVVGRVADAAALRQNLSEHQAWRRGRERRCVEMSSSSNELEREGGREGGKEGRREGGREGGRECYGSGNNRAID